LFSRVGKEDKPLGQVLGDSYLSEQHDIREQRLYEEDLDKQLSRCRSKDIDYSFLFKDDNGMNDIKMEPNMHVNYLLLILTLTLTLTLTLNITLGDDINESEGDANGCISNNDIGNIKKKSVASGKRWVLFLFTPSVFLSVRPSLLNSIPLVLLYYIFRWTKKYNRKMLLVLKY
jgi:hypothetical protein